EESEILSVDVDAVVFRQREPRLELARQIDLAVQRLDIRFGLGVREALTVEPDFVIGARAWRQMGSEPGGGFLQVGMNAVVMMRRGTGHHVAFYVPACSQRA